MGPQKIAPRAILPPLRGLLAGGVGGVFGLLGDLGMKPIANPATRQRAIEALERRISELQARGGLVELRRHMPGTIDDRAELIQHCRDLIERIRGIDD